MILHVLRKSTWETFKGKSQYEHPSLAQEGFIHFSTPLNFHLVAPNFKDVEDEMVILCVDESMLTHPVKYETAPNSTEKYPHLFGYLNTDAIMKVLPYLKDECGIWIKNPEIK